MRQAADQRVGDPHRDAAQDRVGHAHADEPHAERGHEGGDPQPDVDQAVDAAGHGPDQEHEQHAQDAEIVAVVAVQHEQAQDHGPQRQDAFDREVDRAHQDDEGGAQAQHQRDHGGLGDADEVVEAQEVGVDRGDHGAEQDQDQERGEGRKTIAGGTGRPPGRCRLHHLRCHWPRPASWTCSAVLDLAGDAAPDVVPVELRLGLDVGLVELLRVLGRHHPAACRRTRGAPCAPWPGRTCRSWRDSRARGPCRPASRGPRRPCRPSRRPGSPRPRAGCRRCRSPAPCRHGRRRAAPPAHPAPCRHWRPRCP